MNLLFVDWIWKVRGSIALAPGQSSRDALDKLAPLFRQPGTIHKRKNDTLTFTKKDQAAQDKMSVFDEGALKVDKGVAGYVLRYHLTSRALLFCFLAPMLFLFIAQLTVSINKFDRPHHEKPKKDIAVVLNPLDKALGAPPPDDPKKKKPDGAADEDDKLTPTAAYALAAIFAALYVVGRVLEDRLIYHLFKKRLLAT